MEVNISLADLTDRYTILKLKVEHGIEEAVNELIPVMAAMMEAAGKAGLSHREIGGYIRKLHQVNGEIWALEGDIRAGREGLFSLKEVGGRALAIRDKNRIRVAIKNKLVAVAGDGFPDIKINHAST